MLIAVENKDPKSREKVKYYVPELWYLLGLNDKDKTDHKFMEQIIQ